VPSNVKAPTPTLPSNGIKHDIDTPPLTQQSLPPPPVMKTEKPAPPPPPQHVSPPQPMTQTYQAPSFQQGQPMTAEQRAAMNLHQSYGHRAGAQIAQLQSRAQSRVPMPSVPPMDHYIKQEDPNAYANSQDYSQDVKPNAQSLAGNQIDGTGEARDDWNAEYACRKALAAAHGVEGDRLIRARTQTRQQALEAGGLLLPFNERPPVSTSAARDVRSLDASTSARPASSVTRAQGDATGDDDEEEDADAINSDLDDPDELAANAENEETTEQVMLCTYDKVQRVKNKWKCTLKDGILKVDGKE
jgi:transcription initiation factor TFIIA large subunit